MNDLITTVDDCVQWARATTRRERSVGLVPTMGALHEGHLSLIRAAAEQNDAVIVTIFVNPLQFDRAEDLVHYPRSIDRDVELAQSAGATAVFAPTEAEMFPAGAPQITVDPGPFGALLEGVHRPGHFRGVATIVAKLFAITRSDRAYFGEKDYEQLVLIRRLATDLGIPTAIVGMPIVRDPSGLALSSRNQRLDDDGRVIATVLYRALQQGAAYLNEDGGSLVELEQIMAATVAREQGALLDYATVRRSDDLAIIDHLNGSLRLLIAVSIGQVRLIDNLAVER